MRTVLAIALLAVVVTAGCAGPADDAPTEAATATQIPERATTATATATGELPTTGASETTEAIETTGTTETLPDTDDEPQKGDQFLSVMEVNESEATAWNSSERAAFENLSAERQRVVREAVECDCGVELDGEFNFNNKDRIGVVEYGGTYYFLRVEIV